MELPVTREGAVGAIKLLMMVLAAVLLLECARSVGQEMRAQKLLSADPFLRGAARLLVGVETTAPFQQRLSAFWNANHRLIALTLMLPAAVLLLARYIVLGRVFEFMYLESGSRDRRTYAGFMANICALTLHAGFIYAAILLSRGERADLVPAAVMLLFLLNLAWLWGMWVTADKRERKALRGFQYLAVTLGVCAALLFVSAWRIELIETVTPEEKGSELIVLSVFFAVGLCCADAYFQSKAYSRAKDVPAGL